MNVMYFKLQRGEECHPLRDMAVKNFPDVDLKNTTIYADECNENAVLNLMIKQIKEGRFDTLYTNSLYTIDHCMSYNKICDIIKDRPEFSVKFQNGTCYDAETINKIKQEHEDNASVIEKFNAENEPFDITDLDYKYSLALRLSIPEGEYKDYGQAAFDNYALDIGDEENTYGDGYDWARVIKRVFRNYERLREVEIDPEQGCFFCNAKDISILIDMATKLQKLYENTELFERAVNVALSETMSVEELLEKGWKMGYSIETPKGIINITEEDIVRLLHGEMDKVQGVNNDGKFEMSAYDLFQMRVANKPMFKIINGTKYIGLNAVEPDCEELFDYTEIENGMGGIQGM